MIVCLNIVKKIVLISAIFFSQLVYSADLKRMTVEFKRGFWTNLYVESKCHDNILNFVELLKDKEINLSGAVVVRVENSGYENFGMVRGSLARQGGYVIRPTPEYGPTHLAGPKNWYYHVFLVADGQVFDFDYTNEAKVENLKDYFWNMFVEKERMHIQKYLEKTLATYKLTVVPVSSVLERHNEGRVQNYLPTLYPREWIDLQNKLKASLLKQ